MDKYIIHYSSDILRRVSEWDVRFLDLCNHISAWSKDPRTKVGCVIVNGKKDVIIGYNGFPSSIQDYKSRLNDYDLKHKLTVHAERNALDSSNRPVVGNTLYVSYPPCIRCSMDIINRGISRVVCLKSSTEKMNKHKVELELSKKFFNEANVCFDIFNKSNEY